MGEAIWQPPIDHLLEGEVELEITAIAFVRQCCTITLPRPMTLKEAEKYAEATACNRVWDYEGVQDDSMETCVTEKQNTTKREA